jgi:putative ABC transport system substrate-binding protein
VIAATGGPNTVLAAKAATTTIPIVFEIGSDPVQDGLIASFNRPGGNITGVTALNADLDGKRLELLRELAPRAARFGILISTPPTTAITQTRISNVKAAAVALGREIEIFHPTNSREIDQFFASVAENKIDAVFVSASPIYSSLRSQFATAAARRAIPILAASRDMAQAGALMSYGSDASDNWRLVGSYVARILKGEKASDLPVIQPTKFYLVINLQTARTLGIEVPPGLLAITDGVIE